MIITIKIPRKRQSNFFPTKVVGVVKDVNAIFPDSIR